MTKMAERAAQLLSLEGRVAMVTGAASGIGRGIALRLADMGAVVVVLDIDRDGGAETAAAISDRGGKAIFEKCDIRSGQNCKEAVGKSVTSLGRIDILCNNAGVVIRKSSCTCGRRSGTRLST